MARKATKSGSTLRAAYGTGKGTGQTGVEFLSPRGARISTVFRGNTTGRGLAAVKPSISQNLPSSFAQIGCNISLYSSFQQAQQELLFVRVNKYLTFPKGLLKCSIEVVRNTRHSPSPRPEHGHVPWLKSGAPVYFVPSPMCTLPLKENLFLRSSVLALYVCFER